MREVSWHLLDGLDRCGKGRQGTLRATSCFNDIRSEHKRLIGEFGGEESPDEKDIEAMITRAEDQSQSWQRRRFRPSGSQVGNGSSTRSANALNVLESSDSGKTTPWQS